MAKIKKFKENLGKKQSALKKKQTKFLKKNKKLLKNQANAVKQLKQAKDDQEKLIVATPKKKPKKKNNQPGAVLKRAVSQSTIYVKEKIPKKHKKLNGSKPQISKAIGEKIKENAQIVKKKAKKIKEKVQLGLNERSITIKKNKRKKHKHLDAEIKEELQVHVKKDNKFVSKLSEMLNKPKIETGKKVVLSLRERMWKKLKSARFRYLNEEMYTKTGQDSKKLFQSDPDAFKTYHEGYKQQVSHWPINPLDVIIRSIKSMPKDLIIADFGCGEAKLAESVPNQVHSFDLVALNPRVQVCDMSKTPLSNESVDVVVFCLSLMGTNLQDYLIEANRVLKVGGILKISEVESRFEKVDEFVTSTERFGFKHVFKDLTHALFYFFDFTKERNLKNKKKLPHISLNPCLYKKR